MSAPVLAAEGLCKRFGGIAVTQDVGLSIEAGEIHALIGPNGAGKSTLIAQLSGRLRPDSGRVLLNGADVTGLSLTERARRGIVQSFQVPRLFGSFSVLGNVAAAVQACRPHSFRFLRDARRNETLVAPARAILRDLGLGDRADVAVQALSHGERRYVELALSLAAWPAVLLLDEPLAGLSRAETLQMTRILRALKGRCAMLLVEHDMEAVFSLADRVSVLVDGAVVAVAAPDEIRRDPVVRAAYLGEEEPDQRAMAIVGSATCSS
jgi:branched-chain amino acid transport system ATP-binding protein